MLILKKPQSEILFFDYEDTVPTYQSAKILEVEISHFDSYKDKSYFMSKFKERYNTC